MPAEFEAFLFAPVREEPNGMTLSVVSALARLDIDPWQEAASLAILPIEVATRRLASLIATLPGASLDCPKPDEIAASLIALLPGHGRIRNPQHETFLGFDVSPKTRAAICVFIALLALAVQCSISSGQSPTLDDGMLAPVSGSYITQRLSTVSAA